LIERGVDHGLGSGGEASGKSNGNARHVEYEKTMSQRLFQFFTDPLYLK
jgi:hypothetical protein